MARNDFEEFPGLIVDGPYAFMVVLPEHPGTFHITQLSRPLVARGYTRNTYRAATAAEILALEDKNSASMEAMSLPELQEVLSSVPHDMWELFELRQRQGDSNMPAKSKFVSDISIVEKDLCAKVRKGDTPGIVEHPGVGVIGIWLTSISNPREKVEPGYVGAVSPRLAAELITIRHTHRTASFTEVEAWESVDADDTRTAQAKYLDRLLSVWERALA